MAKIKLKRYKKLEITHDCLVPKGAMQVESVFKEVKDGVTEFTKRKTYEDMVVKFDDEKQIMYNIMVKWNKPDSDGWILDDEDIRRDAMLYFMEKGDKVLKFTHQKDDDKEPYSIDARTMEFFMVKENDPIYSNYVGSIARAAYFKDKEEFDFIKDLEFETSIEGFAMLEDFEVDDTAYKIEKEKAIHRIKDLLKNTFKFKDGKLTKKGFDEMVVIAMKDFDTVLENRRNTDVYYAVSALCTAIYDAEWNNLYDSPKDVPAFKKEVAKVIKQFLKYMNEMTFEIVKKEEIPNKEKGDHMETKDVQEVQAMIDKALAPVVKSLGLEEGQTIADVIQKAIGEIIPPKTPVVKAKDEEGKDIEISLIDAVVGLTTTIKEREVKVDEELKLLKEGITKNTEVALTDDELKAEKEKEDHVDDAIDDESGLT